MTLGRLHIQKIAREMRSFLAKDGTAKVERFRRQLRSEDGFKSWTLFADMTDGRRAAACSICPAAELNSFNG
jgi:hypothetical protein